MFGKKKPKFFVKLIKSQKKKKLFKILVVPRNFHTGFVAFFIKDFIDGLIKKGWHIVDSESQVKSNNILKDIQEATGIKKNPYIIAFYILRNKIFKKWKNFKDFNAVKVLITEDLHNPSDVDALKEVLPWIDAIFSRYPRYTMSMAHPYKPLCFNLFHASTSLFYIPIHFDKKIDKVLLSGAIEDDYYVLRNKAAELIHYTDLVKMREHPGYTVKDSKTESKNYAKDISKYKIAISDQGSIPGKKHPYILAKHFEIPSAGTSLLTHKNLAPYLKDLGFKEDYNYITATPKTLLKKIEYWLDPKNQTKLRKITERGQKLVLKSHMNKLRVSQFDSITRKLYFCIN